MSESKQERKARELAECQERIQAAMLRYLEREAGRAQGRQGIRAK